ncbi:MULTISPECIES: RNA polymerase sigma factor [Micromonospora]|uniref:RNA polymerase sigma factor n=1 Tax=Micromonospora TaxID=1873 RepID=UPI001FE18EA2|nr:RNA polymerase sigma factor [Micromonospora matsumotoense]
MGDQEAVTEVQLVRRCARGEHAAFDELYRRTAPWLATRLRRRCSDDEIVAEVLQETFMAVWRSAGSFTGSAQSGATGWIWTIAARRLVDAFRHRARAAELPLAIAAAPAPAAEDEVLAGRVDADLLRALHTLAPEVRRVLQAMVLDGLSVRDTSALLGVPESTVKLRARMARIRLREALS